MASLSGRVAKLEKLFVPESSAFFPEYRDRPGDFALDVLGIDWTPAQREIAESLLHPPFRTLVKASHNVGKTHASAGVLLWWHLTRRPSIIISTAPKLEQVRDLLWKEVRRQCRGLVTFSGPRTPRIDRSAEDFAAGTTAKNSTAFAGHHGPDMLFIFDEAVGVDAGMWEVAETMFMPPGHAWLCIFNPTDSGSAAYQAEQARGRDGRPLWRVITMSALDHPNVSAELRGEQPPVPWAIRLGRLRDMLEQWCQPVAAEDALRTDVEFPPGSGKWLRPGPLAEARLLGRWPSRTEGVWSDALWSAAESREPALPPPGTLPEVGCDVARFGDDFTEIHVRCGGVSLHHERANGWDTAQTAGRLKELAREWCAWANARLDPNAARRTPEEVPVKVDDDGVGGGVTDQAGGYNFVGVSSGARAGDPEGYPNRRSELWFSLADRAARGDLSLFLLPEQVRRELRQQAMAPVWRLDAAGRRVVEPKEITKEKLGRSPDGLDAMNLAWYEAAAYTAPSSVGGPAPRPLFGRR